MRGRLFLAGVLVLAVEHGICTGIDDTADNTEGEKVEEHVRGICRQPGTFCEAKAFFDGCIATEILCIVKERDVCQAVSDGHDDARDDQEKTPKQHFDEDDDLQPDETPKFVESFRKSCPDRHFVAVGDAC